MDDRIVPGGLCARNSRERSARVVLVVRDREREREKKTEIRSLQSAPRDHSLALSLRPLDPAFIAVIAIVHLVVIAVDVAALHTVVPHSAFSSLFFSSRVSLFLSRPLVSPSRAARARCPFSSRSNAAVTVMLRTDESTQAGRQAGQASRQVDGRAGSSRSRREQRRIASRDDRECVFFRSPRKYAGSGERLWRCSGRRVLPPLFTAENAAWRTRSHARALQRAPPRHVRLDSGSTRPASKEKRTFSLSFCVSLPEVSRAHTRGRRIARRSEQVGQLVPSELSLCMYYM